SLAMPSIDWASFRSSLLANKYYLGNPQLLDDVTWASVGWEELVVSAKAAREYASSSDTTLTNETISGLEHIPLTLFAKISSTDCFLASCAYWKGPTAYTPTFADVKLNCRLVAPEGDAGLANDFRVALRNLEQLLENVQTKGYKQVGIFDSEETVKTGIKLRHVLFSPKESNEAEAEPDNDEFPLAKWPAQSEAAQAALNNMAAESTHRVNRIRAYDLNGNLIPPASYASALRGATVRAEISISHWKINKDGGRDVYVADIDTLRVIRAPPVKMASPVRRRAVVPARDSGPSPLNNPTAESDSKQASVAFVAAAVTALKLKAEGEEQKQEAVALEVVDVDSVVEKVERKTRSKTKKRCVCGN
ncbi:hypothetical protein R3P38DRAFT_2843059, partial [Favolaschia claudopus]